MHRMYQFNTYYLSSAFSVVYTTRPFHMIETLKYGAELHYRQTNKFYTNYTLYSGNVHW